MKSFWTSYSATRGGAHVLTGGYKPFLMIATAGVYESRWVPGEMDEPFLELGDEQLAKVVESRCTTLCIRY